MESWAGADEAEWRQIFEFAKKIGLYGITTESVNQLDIIEKLVKEFDIRVGIHEHARRANDANYKVWDPNYVLSVVKDRDKRIGACADTGHWATSGIKPLDGIKLLRGHIISLHLKERTEIGKQLPDAVYGTGVSNIKGILDELKKQGFEGNISIEYENNWTIRCRMSRNALDLSEGGPRAGSKKAQAFPTAQTSFPRECSIARDKNTRSLQSHIRNGNALRSI